MKSPKISSKILHQKYPIRDSSSEIIFNSMKSKETIFKFTKFNENISKSIRSNNLVTGPGMTLSNLLRKRYYRTRANQSIFHLSEDNINDHFRKF